MPRRLPWVSPGRVSGVDTHDVGAFPTAAWRARILRIAFALAAVLLVAAAAWSTRDLETQERGLLPSGTTGVVVIDLSLSITDNDYDTLRGVFRRLIDGGREHRARRLLGRLVRAASARNARVPAPSGASAARPSAARAARESVDADIPRGHADLVGAPAGEDDARARRSTTMDRSCS